MDLGKQMRDKVWGTLSSKQKIGLTQTVLTPKQRAAFVRIIQIQKAADQKRKQDADQKRKQADQDADQKRKQTAVKKRKQDAKQAAEAADDAVDSIYVGDNPATGLWKAEIQGDTDGSDAGDDDYTNDDCCGATQQIIQFEHEIEQYERKIEQLKRNQDNEGFEDAVTQQIKEKIKKYARTTHSLIMDKIKNGIMVAEARLASETALLKNLQAYIYNPDDHSIL